MRKLFGFTGILLLLLIVILVVNTLRAKPWPKHMADALLALPDSAVLHMSKAIQIATISPQDTTHIDTIDFDAFRRFMETAYPLIHQQLTRTIINGYSYIYEWKGSDTTLQPDIFMAHYDVVPVEASAIPLWKAKPFGGEVKEDAIWGRGSVDDKSSLIAILEATEGLLHKNFKPQRTIYLCFGHNEESIGTGAVNIVKYLKAKHVQAGLVIDEGGEISTEQVKDVKRPLAMIGVAEKGYVTFEMSVAKTGGHSSVPPKETAIDILSKALYKLRQQQMPASITPPIKEFLSRISGSSDNFINKLGLTNMWLLQSIVVKKLSAVPDGDAMFHTTIVPTILESGVRENVIPTNARAVINSRVLTGETDKEVLDFITTTVDDKRVNIKMMGDFATEPSAATDVHSAAFTRVENAVYKVVDNAIPTPFLMLGATDSRSYRDISNSVLNFVPLTDSKGFHGIDERLPVKDLQRSITFYTLLMQQDGK